MKLYQSLVAGLVVCGFAFAVENATTTTTTAPATEKAVPAKEKAAPAKVAKKEAAIQIHGSVVSVDAIGNTVIIKSKKADDTLTVNEKTVITVGGKTTALADLKADTKVAAIYKKEEGKNVAIKITEKVAAVKAAPAKAEAPAAK